MLITKTNPTGIDAKIDKLQRYIHARLVDLLDYNPTQVDALLRAYPRCYRNKKDTGYIAEWFIGGTDYEEVYLNDALSCSFFFGLADDEIEYDKTNKANVHLVVFAKLTAFGNDRPDEYVREQFRKWAAKNAFGFTLTGTEMWLENVLREYPGSRRDERLKNIDMHPFHCFRLNFSINYSSFKC